MKIRYSIVAELEISLNDENKLSISYFKDKKNIGNCEPKREYVPNKMEIDIVDVNTIRIGFNYECSSNDEISIELLKLRVKNRLCQNLIATHKNGLIGRLADKIKEMAINDGYDIFMANSLKLKFKELANAEKLSELLKDIDSM